MPRLLQDTLHTLCIVLLCAWLGMAQAVAGSLTLLGVGGPAAGGAASYAFINSTFSTGSGANVSGSFNIGTAAANRVIIVAGVTQAAGTPTSVTVNSVSCTIDVGVTNVVIASCPGVSYGSGAQTVAVNWSAGSFNGRGFSVWVGTNMTSTTVVQKTNTTGAPGNMTISVTANDFMFGVYLSSNAGGPATWSTSTQSPAATELLNSGCCGTADWTISSTNASFAAQPNFASMTADAVATYH
jgi:hypothetical protein